MNPIIGISAASGDGGKSLSLSQGYIRAVLAAGGIPVILPYLGRPDIKHILNSLDGIILSGGGDISPIILGEAPSAGISCVFPKRDYFELELARECVRVDKPLLGICRGMQVLCAAMGGRILQDISDSPKYISHSQPEPRNYPSHTVAIKQNTLISDITNIYTHKVNSFHHQAVDFAGKNMCPSAFAPDGVIESVEHTKKSFILGVQWHPECLFRKSTADKKIFEAFIKAAKNMR